MTDLPALLAKVKALTGPDRGVDAAIAEALGIQPAGSIRDDRTDIDGCFGPRGYAVWWTSPSYTASVDAALALVERVLPGYCILMAFNAGKLPDTADIRAVADVHPEPLGTPQEWHGPAKGATPALAILAALLTALIAKGEQHGQG